ncbi:hypothetical protein KI387_041653, partial [Taxus chinensis]
MPFFPKINHMTSSAKASVAKISHNRAFVTGVLDMLLDMDGSKEAMDTRVAGAKKVQKRLKGGGDKIKE